MKKTLLFLMLSFAAIYSYSQDYSNAIGLKFSYAYGTGAGLNWKHTMGDSKAFELTLGGGAGVLWLQGLYEFQKDLSSVAEGVKWYYGIGADLGTFSRGYTYGGKTYSSMFAGVDGVIGIEYTLPNVPINFALDTGPTLRVVPYVGFGWSGGLAIRYAIKK